ncbi:MAG: SDR family NAD(P)-dependent oxidoreductase, partial [Anaerolineae bacterium]
VALIVGAGEHLGRSVPLLFAQEGASVVVAARREHVLDETVRMIRQKGGQAVKVVGDATRPSDVDRMVETAVEQFGGLDILYNNIGGSWVELDRKLHEVSDQAFQQIVSVNLTAIYYTSRRAIPEMLRRGGGVIINVAASRTVRMMSNAIYAATKAGMIEMTRKMAQDYIDDNIRVNCLCPGLFVYEPVTDPVVRPVAKPLIRRQPKTARQGDPADLAYAALYLASDEASWVTGQAIVVDGGDEVKLTDIVLE